MCIDYRLFLVKKVKTSFYHDLMIFTKRDASLTSEASDRRPFECKSSKSDRKTLLFLQDVFFFNFRALQTTLPPFPREVDLVNQGPLINSLYKGCRED